MSSSTEYVISLQGRHQPCFNANESFSEPTEIFKNACEIFRSALSDDEKRVFQEFPDAKSMLAVIKQQAKDHPIHESRLTACCKKISGLAVKLSPFFEVVNIFVQTNPQYIRIAWGAIRLVFQVRYLPVLILI